MAVFRHKRTGREMSVSGAAVEAAYAANSSWRLVVEPRQLTPKQRLQADAETLGLSTDGTVDELTARIDAKVAELLKQAKELGIDGDTLSGPELLAAVDAKLAE